MRLGRVVYGVDKISIIIETFKLQYELSERETEVLILLIQGLSNDEIGNRLNLSTKTIKNIVSAILAKSNMQTRYKLQAKAIEMLCTPISEW